MGKYNISVRYNYKEKQFFFAKVYIDFCASFDKKQLINKMNLKI